MSFAVTRSLRSLRSSELTALQTPAEPAPSALMFLPPAVEAASGGVCVRRIGVTCE